MPPSARSPAATRGMVPIPNSPAIGCTARREWTPVIIEVVRKAEVASYDAFQTAILANALRFEDKLLTYRGLSGDTFTFYADFTHPPKINDQTVDYAPEKVFDSPFIQSKWNSGVVTIRKGAPRVGDRCERGEGEMRSAVLSLQPNARNSTRADAFMARLHGAVSASATRALAWRIAIRFPAATSDSYSWALLIAELPFVGAGGQVINMRLGFGVRAQSQESPRRFRRQCASDRGPSRRSSHWVPATMPVYCSRSMRCVHGQPRLSGGD